jgi:hypothetical protein
MKICRAAKTTPVIPKMTVTGMDGGGSNAMACREGRRLRRTGPGSKKSPRISEGFWSNGSGLVFAVQCFTGFVFQAANGVLGLTLDLLSFTLSFCLRIAGHLADAFFDLAFDVRGGTFNAVFIHVVLLVAQSNPRQDQRLRGTALPFSRFRECRENW